MMMRLLASVVFGLVFLFVMSCSGGTGPEPGRETSDTYYMLSSTFGSAVATYYVISDGIQGGYEVLRIIDPTESVDFIEYTEVTVYGSGPDGIGTYILRIIDPGILPGEVTLIHTFLVSSM